MVFLIIIVIGLVLAAIAVSRVKFHIEYHRNQKDDRFFVNVAIVRGLLRFKTEFTVLDFEKRLKRLTVKAKAELEAELGEAGAGFDTAQKVPITYRNMRFAFRILEKILQNFRFYQNVLLKLARLTRIKELDWVTRFGTGDAAVTGIAAGVLWSLKSVAIKGLYGLVQGSLNQTRIKVLPDFGGNSLNIDLHCIFDIKTGHIIIAGCKILMIKLKLLFLRSVKGV